ncbi:signal recognition particle subunit SRP68-like isoform X2 [Paramacrobiotus metropolitanus]|uniref:signal recognition particle subunit SRP68-like isoform X2 n=1 Tax=Paramacrobiotus metropolitanus TaxID=2943436 RepID=UPI002445FFB7|nr:signal recognition particle subunit SRP68-like isoform X2 [Paramacrobiotus metropolitanus]
MASTSKKNKSSASVSVDDVDSEMRDLTVEDAADAEDEEAPEADEEMEGEGEEGDKTRAAADEIFSLEVLKVVKEAQQARGLRHGDYVRYRQYCARKIHRLRSCFSLAQGTKTRFHGKVLKADHIRDARCLQIPLFIAERAWSYGMQLKQEAGQAAHPRRKFHMLRRFAKASRAAQHLQRLCETLKVDARTKLETQAYVEWMQGVVSFNAESWREALESFSQAKAIYESIASTLDEETRQLYRQRIDETVPQIRFCGYNIGDESAVEDLIKMRLKPGSAELGEGLMAKLDELIAQSREKQAQTEISWLGKSVPVKNAKVRGLLISAQEGARQLDSLDTADAKLEVLENTQNVLREALQAVQDEQKAVSKEQPAAGAGQQLLHSYITFLKNHHSNQRALLTIQIMRGKVKLSAEKEAEERKKKHKAQDYIRLYDTMVENNNETVALTGVTGTALMESLNASTQLYKGFRALHIGDAFVSVKKFPEALTFYARAAEFADAAVKALSKAQATESLTELEALVISQKDAALAYSVLQKEEFSDLESEMIARHRKANNELEIALAKPVTFDLVLEAIKLPNLDDRLASKKAKAKPASGKAEAAPAKEKTGPAAAAAAAGGGISALKGWMGWGKKS